MGLPEIACLEESRMPFLMAVGGERVYLGSLLHLAVTSTTQKKNVYPIFLNIRLDARGCSWQPNAS